MTMVASASRHFQVMCSAPTWTVCPTSKEATLSPAQVSQRVSPSTANDEQSITIGVSSSSSLHQSAEVGSANTSLAFVYGTLKRGFGNHWLIEEQMREKHCRLVGTAQTKHKYPLVCGPFQVPFLLNVCGRGEHVRGELYLVDSHCLGLLDELEGISKGHYVRSPLTLTGVELDLSFDADDALSFPKHQQQGGHHSSFQLGGEGDIQAEAYFAANHFTPGLYQAAPHIEAYTEKESATYTRRIHRPQNRTFVEHVYHWIDEKKQQTSSSPIKVSSN